MTTQWYVNIGLGEIPNMYKPVERAGKLYRQEIGRKYVVHGFIVQNSTHHILYILT